MEAVLTILGTLFFVFLVLSAAVEVIVEMIRNILETFVPNVFPVLKSKISFEDAIKLADELAPDNKDLQAKIATLTFTNNQIKKIGGGLNKSANGIKTTLDSIKTKLGEDKNLLSQSLPNPDIVGEMNEAALKIKEQLDEAERKKIFFLRALSIGVGCLLVKGSHFYVFDILANSKEVIDITNQAQSSGGEGFNLLSWIGNFIGNLKGHDLLNIVIGGAAAGVGSSFWHDQLDRIRNLKTINQDIGKLISK